jgi:hypothetical protein
MVLSTDCSYSSGAKPDKNTNTHWVPGDGFRRCLRPKDERLKALRLGKSSVLTQIRCEVEQKLESVNTLINQILKQYVKWHTHTPKCWNVLYFKKPDGFFVAEVFG